MPVWCQLLSQYFSRISMGYKVLITGSTGMVGKGVLLECLKHPAISGVLLINRRSVEINHAKITEIIHDNFQDFSGLSEKLTAVDACFFCLGISALGKSEMEYTKITYDITLSLARELSRLNPDVVFCYVSGAGTNVKSRSMWARVKGKTEQDLLKLPFKKVVLFRPGFIQPLGGIRSSTGWYDTLYKITGPITPVLRKLFPKSITDTADVGLAMINCLTLDTHPQVMNNRDINELAAANR